MKVRELVKKVHLIDGQRIAVNNYTTGKTYRTTDRYGFNIDSKAAEEMYNWKVNSFDVCADGLKIWAE